MYILKGAIMKKNRIEPFRAYLYDSSVVNLSAAMAPPYDVYGYDDQVFKELRSYRYNISYIDKPGQANEEDRYIIARSLFNDFLNSGALVQDKKKTHLCVPAAMERRQPHGRLCSCSSGPRLHLHQTSWKDKSCPHSGPLWANGGHGAEYRAYIFSIQRWRKYSGQNQQKCL